METTQKHRLNSTPTPHTRTKNPHKRTNHGSNNQKIETTPDITLKELITEFNLHISTVALSKRLVKLGYTFKKKTSHPKEQEKPSVIKERELWHENQPNLQVANSVFLDESFINFAYARLYGWAKSNQRVHEGIKDVRFKRQSMVSTVCLSGEKVAFVFGGTLNRELFVEYLRVCLVPAFESGMYWWCWIIFRCILQCW
ncbi:MAG: hypothetical protein LBC12_00785 [Nitrososphaerota archaeon]|jgi:hypothetical protein|nr:hypothetical protein [Nitrososphaerota archaeon]